MPPRLYTSLYVRGREGEPSTFINTPLVNLRDETSGNYPINDGRRIGVSFELDKKPPKVLVDCSSIEELQGKHQRRVTRTLQFDYKGIARTNIGGSTWLEMDLERVLDPERAEAEAQYRARMNDEAARRAEELERKRPKPSSRRWESPQNSAYVFEERVIDQSLLGLHESLALYFRKGGLGYIGVEPSKFEADFDNQPLAEDQTRIAVHLPKTGELTEIFFQTAAKAHAFNQRID